MAILYKNGSMTSRPTFEDRLEKDIRDALRTSGYSELNHVEVEIDGHELCLTGQVSSYFLRQKAECIALNHPDIAVVHSDIEVAHSNLASYR